MFKNLLIATIFVTITLAAIILLTQSLRFLELVINSGASSVSFWVLTFLALPRFFEIILPIAIMSATVFIYNKMSLDNELVVMRSIGSSPMSLARPAIILSIITTILLLVMTTYVGPKSLSNMQHMRQVIKAQYSSFLFQQGVFNSVVPGLTIYIRERTSGSALKGLMIHDNRKTTQHPVTIIAKNGVLVITDEGQQVLVSDGSRHEYNSENMTLSRLDFDRYSIDLPDGSGPVRQRWREPDERSFWELLNPDMENSRDVESKRDFTVEIHRRIVSPFLAPAFVMLSLVFLLLGPTERRGQGWRIAMIVVGTVIIQGLYLGAFNLSRQSDLGLILMYALTFIPIAVSSFMLSSSSEKLRNSLLYKKEAAQ
jgi:lipopolysaccharide export system permease protein